MRILVTGASGLLGLNFCLKMAKSHDITGIIHRNALKDVPFRCVQTDLTEPNILQGLIADYQPQFVLNCAAMADVEACERHPEQAKRINAEMPGELASICEEKKIKMVHISTDAVFDGRKGNYCEEDEPNPLSVYASSKLAGEKNVMLINTQALVVRTNFYGFSISGRHSLAEFFLKHLLKRKEVNGFVDVIFCPLYVADLTETLMQMVYKNLSGLYHVVSPECLSKYEFGVNIAKIFGCDPALVRPSSIAQSGLTAPRPPRLDLNIGKLQSEKIVPPAQAEGLEHFYQDYQAGLPERIKSYAL